MRMLTSCADILKKKKKKKKKRKKKKWSLCYQNSVLDFFKSSSRIHASPSVLLNFRPVI
jgi:hypothetical protein